MATKIAPRSIDIKELALGYGVCFATDMITVQGQPVGYMYRDDPRDEADSGWVFLSGGESEAYMSDPENHHVYDVNTIANYDPTIIEYLDAPYGTGFERDADGKFVELEE